MAHFTIVGTTKCPETAHAVYIAKLLSKNLRNFSFSSSEKTQDDWEIWLKQTNLDNSWNHSCSPLIWKEISLRGGMKSLIGGLSEFRKYCHNYYGFESKLSKSDLAKIMADNAFITTLHKEKAVKTVSVYNANNHPFLEFLLLEVRPYLDKETYNFKLFDKNIDNSDCFEAFLQSTEELGLLLEINSNRISIVTSTEELLVNCELLFVLGDYSQNLNETVDCWLQRCKQEMIILAQDINKWSLINLRVVLCHFGANCFNASILVEYCTRIRLSNIVAVTADEGMSIVNVLAEKADTPIKNFNCPPVWGFCGLRSYIPIGATVLKADVYRPYKRALTARQDSQLPKGTITVELRLLGNVIATDESLYKEIEMRKKKQLNMLGRLPILAKVRATGSLIKLWYAEKIGDEIISLGACSNGSFGFLPKIVLSQPVILNERRIWEPFPNMEVASETLSKVSEMVQNLSDLFKKFGLGNSQD